MIRLLLLDRYRETIDCYLHMWARSLRNDLRPLVYESIFPSGNIQGGIFIFSDLERLREDELSRAETLAEKISTSGGRVFNRPSKALRRYELLRALHDAGKNPFNVYRVDELNNSIRYPVFIRRAREHSGALSPLLNNLQEVNCTIADLKSSLPVSDDLLIVEYIHTQRESLFRKYSAMRMGDALIPRHILFSNHWMDKDADVVTSAAVEEENAFLKDFPHADQIREIFNLANIEYGRIDYSILDGKVLTWEINTNPRILPNPGKCDPQRMQGQAISAKLMREAFECLAKCETVTVSLDGCPRIIDDARMSSSRRMIYAGSWVWDRLSRSKWGRRVLEGVVNSIRLGLEHG